VLLLDVGRRVRRDLAQAHRRCRTEHQRRAYLLHFTDSTAFYRVSSADQLAPAQYRGPLRVAWRSTGDCCGRRQRLEFLRRRRPARRKFNLPEHRDSGILGDAPERLVVDSSPPPFPIYPDPTEELLRAHVTTSDRDPAVAHILAVLSGYAYGDTATVATMASRLGMAGSACLRISQTVDAMLIFSTAYLLQSRCGRVVILCYRGTEPTSLGNWLGDADVGSHVVDLGGPCCRPRDCRNTRDPMGGPRAAVRGGGRSSGGTGSTTRFKPSSPANLGGAMAVLFAGLAGEHRSAAPAVYTFGQPLTDRCRAQSPSGTRCSGTSART
jgi:hypothetical protein